MKFTQERAENVKAWIDRQVGKDCSRIDVTNRPDWVSSEGDSFLRVEPSGDTSICIEFKSNSR